MARRSQLLLPFLLLAAARLGGAQLFPVRAPPPATATATAPVNGTVSTVITVAVSVFFFLIFFCAYINQCRFAEAGGIRGPPDGGGGGGSSRGRRRGLEPAVMETFPIIGYKDIKEHKVGRSVLECAVCLTAFDDGDDLRLLPQCSHAFHPDCIDPWLAAHVTCPLCRANLEKPAPAPAPPEPAVEPPEAVVVQVEAESSDDEDEAMELERLRSARREARMPRSHSTGHSLFLAAAAASGGAAAEGRDHERFTLRLPYHVREQVLRSRRLRHATSLVSIADAAGGGGGGGEGSSRGGTGGSSHGVRRWPSFLARTVTWAKGGDGSVRRGGEGSGKGGGEGSVRDEGRETSQLQRGRRPPPPPP